MMNQKRVNLTNIIAYLQGNIRYYLYYSRFKFMIRKHIREQIDFRIKFMDKACYENGQCKLCGCATTALQMANKSCDKPCYPKMMPKSQWKNFYSGMLAVRQGDQFWDYYPSQLFKVKSSKLELNWFGSIHTTYPNDTTN